MAKTAALAAYSQLLLLAVGWAFVNSAGVNQFLAPLAIGALLASEFGAGLYLDSRVRRPSRPGKVTVFGEIMAAGYGRHPESITFMSDNDDSFEAVVVGNGYSVDLPNDLAYEVRIQWTDSAGVISSSNAGALIIDQAPGEKTLVRSWSF